MIFKIVRSYISVSKITTPLPTAIHEKKFKNLTKNIQVPFTSDVTIKDLSSYKLTEEKAEILKYGLKTPIEPKHLLKTGILTTFKKIHRSLSRDLKD